MSNTTETPLLDLLKSVPADARMIYEHSPIESSSIPVGVLAKRAADALTAQANSLGFLRQISEQQAYEINQQAAEIEALRVAEADFHMEYRLKCDVETKAQAAEIEALRAALQEADTIMGHDEDATEWRVKWGRLWVGKAVTP